MKRLLGAIIILLLGAVPAGAQTYLLPSKLATYRATITANAAYATPTDIVGICGSATKTVYVNQFSVSVQSTAAALQSFLFIKRATADTGGTPTLATALPDDSGLAAATATVTSFAAAPTISSTVGNFEVVRFASGTLTTAPGIGSLYTHVNPATAVTFNLPVSLRGAGECIYANYAGAALTSGYVADYFVSWEEF